MSVVIIGHGAWGSALESLVAKNKVTCRVDARIFAVPTQALRHVLEEQKATLSEDTAIINCSKGIEKETHLLPFQIAEEVLGKRNYFSLIGPSFSSEVLQQMPTLVCLGYTQKQDTIPIRDLFETQYFRVIETPGVASLELLGAFKNVYAIAAGLTDGLGFGMNTRAKIIGLAYQEFRTLARALHYSIYASALPAIIGDLVLTCNSIESRNFTFGRLLAGWHIEQALEKINATVEGYHTAASVGYFRDKTNVALPVAMLVKESIESNNPATIRQRFTAFVEHI